MHQHDKLTCVGFVCAGPMGGTPQQLEELACLFLRKKQRASRITKQTGGISTEQHSAFARSASSSCCARYRSTAPFRSATTFMCTKLLTTIMSTLPVTQASGSSPPNPRVSFDSVTSVYAAVDFLRTCTSASRTAHVPKAGRSLVEAGQGRTIKVARASETWGSGRGASLRCSFKS